MKSTLTIVVFLGLLYLGLQTSFQCNVANCQFCSFPNSCGVCQPNYILTQNTATGSFACTQVPCVSNCNYCYRSGICENCTSGNFVNSTGSCLSSQSSNSSVPPNCLWGANSQSCTLCAYGFTLQAGYCYPTISVTYDDTNCMVKMTSTICQICQSGFYVSPIGKCIPIIINQNNCNIQNCAYCTNSNSTCALCYPGYQLTQSNTCTQNTCNMAGCIACAGTGQCSTCSPGYTLNTVAKTCSLSGFGCNILWCQTCSSAQSCGQCQPGFTLAPYQLGSTSVNLCKKLPCPYNVTNCASCTYIYDSIFNYNKVLCAPGMCNANYIYVNGYCVMNLLTTPWTCTLPNCNTCSYNNFCSACNAGYTLTRYGTCQVAVCSIQNCQSCSLNNICQQCSAGFSLNIGNIALSQNNLYTNPYTYAYFMLYQQCIPNTISCTVANCAYCTQSNTCAQCAAGYDFPTANSNVCNPLCTVSNCFQCAQSNQAVCQYCNTGFQLASNGAQCTAITFSCGSGCSNSTANSCSYNWITKSGQCSNCQTSTTLFNGQCFSQTCNIFGCSLCASWATPVVCMRCNQGLFLSSGYCIKPNCNNNVANCANCIQGGKCVGCMQGYYLQNNSGTVTCILASSISNCMVDNCLACSSPNQCTTCASPYIQKNGICVCNFQNCLDCSFSALTCDSCPQPLFATLQEPGCTPQPSLIHTCTLANCQMCLSTTQCSICAIGYRLNPADLSCVMNNCAALGQQNCQICDQFGYQCFLCNVNFMVDNFLQGGNCQPVNSTYTCNITGCSVCSLTNSSICTTCLPTFMISASKTQCTPYTCNIANCYLCLENNFCTVCDSGFFLATDLTCQPLYTNITNCQNQIQYCDICVIGLVNSNNQKYCIMCQNGFQFDTSNQVCIPQTNSIPNCKIQEAWGFALQPYCLTCVQGFFTNSWGLCTAYNPATANTGCDVYNCLYCGVNSTLCSFCLVPWGLNSAGVCQASIFCPANCQFCTNPSTCLTCMTSYTLNSTGVCIFCSIAGCATCQQTNVCATCQSLFTPANGLCLSCNIASCSACSDNNVCKTCASGSIPSSTGSSCVTCDTTLANMANCISCSSNNFCGVCQSGYQLYSASASSQVCILCTKPNCLTCDTNGCTLCAIGYTLSGGNCVQCSFPCATCNSDNSCATCSTPFYFSTPMNSACVVNTIPNCNTYNTGNTTLCATCNQFYALNSSSNTCYLTCPQNCQSCPNNPAVCTTCMAGYFATSSGSCTPCQVAGCLNCATNIATCSSCANGFYPLNNVCKQCPSFCSTCTSLTSCQSLTQSNQQVLVTQSNGQSALAVCQQNCQTCSNVNPLSCLQCANGFYLNSATGNCLQCSSNCLTCSSTSASQCVTCYPNSFLTGTTCSSCSSNCLTCASSNDPSNCKSCFEGFHLSGTTCVQGCPLNCLNCLSSTQCTQCLSGYTLFNQNSNQICAPCITTCRTCALGQPASCLTCGSGFYLSGSSCVPCITNCNTCNAAGCSACITGYFLTSALTCSLNCILPCSTCLSGSPNLCTACIAGYSYNSLTNTCSQILSCNGACSVCPLGYALNLGKCILCTGSQCQSCIFSTPSQCTSCLPGFYLNTNNQCQACASSCATCLTGSGCLTCAAGFTQIQNLPINQNGFQCVACNSPCATCINTPNYCTSCVSGFQFMGWKCSQSFYFGFSLTLLTTLSTFNANYFTFLLALTTAIGGPNSNSITILSITPGSVIVQGGAAPTGASGSKQSNQQFSSLDASLSTNTQIAGMTIGESSVSVVGGSVDYSDINLALILGICIPLIVLLITGTALYIYCKKKKSADIIQRKIKQDSGFTVRQSFELSANYKDENSSRPFEQTTAIN